MHAARPTSPADATAPSAAGHAQPVPPPPQSPLAGIAVRGPLPAAFAEVLTPRALAFVAELERRFRGRRDDLLHRRAERQRRLDRGEQPDFLAVTANVRAADWRVAPAPPELQDRRVEITGPVDRKMIVNALNSGADVFLADFEDALAPTWRNVVQGQRNLIDAVRGTIEHVQPDTGKVYRLAERTATLVVRPRGWHLDEAHVTIDGRPVTAALFDFGLWFFHNAAELVARGRGPHVYLPKLESHLEARLWNDVFVAAQDHLELPLGTVRATVLIETVLAAFEMDEILFELRDHAVGLNCGRWDYVFSVIKRFRGNPAFVLPDRGRVTMEQRFLRAYGELLIATCHRRGAHAMGGMAAQIPLKDPTANAAALDKVRADKRREAHAGHDGTWVAHPALVDVARAEFDAVLQGRPHQLHCRRDDVRVSAADLLAVPSGPITEAGLRTNLRVGLLYLEAWLRGVGCVPIDGLMEDAATAEISRTQVWQWLRHDARLDDGRRIDPPLVRRVLAEELSRATTEAVAGGRHTLAAQVLDSLLLASELPEFLTLAAYEHLVTLTDGDLRR